MFSFWHAPGGLARRAAAEVVPLLVGAAAAGLGVALLGPLPGALAGLAAWLGTSGTLAFVRLRPRLVRLYRLALLGHVLFWGARGLIDGAVDPAGPLGPVEHARWEGARAFKAGAAEASFWLPEHAALAGWGRAPRRAAWPAFYGLGALGRLGLGWQAQRAGEDEPARRPLLHEAQGIGDPLGARALVLIPEGAGPTLAFVRLDTPTSDAGVAAAVLARVTRLGLTAPTLLLTASHTHSGLGGYSKDSLQQVLALDHHDPVAFESVVTAAASAIEQAHLHARPARIAFGAARDRGSDGAPILARRRAGADSGDVEERVLALRVELDAGRTFALLLNHAVHPVSVRPQHPTFDRDLVGAVEEHVSARLPGRPFVLFLQGALGDVAPRVVRSAEQPRVLAQTAEAFADAVADGLLAGPLYDRLEVRAARVERDLGDPTFLAALGDRGRFLDATTPSPLCGPLLGVAGDALALPLNALLWSAGFTEARVAASLDGALGVRVNLERSVAQRRHAVGGLLLAASQQDGGARAALPLLWCPGEPTTEVGRSWRAAFAREGDLTPLLLGLTNGSIAYVASAREQRAGGYEALCTLYGPETERLLAEGLAAVRAALAAP